MTSLVYPSVYSRIGRIGESECWRGLWKIFRFRPRPPVFMRLSALLGSGAFLQNTLDFYKSGMSAFFVEH
jgi:hypothetical protein